MKTETWKEITEFGGYYQVSDFGKVRSMARRIFVVPSATGRTDGYYRNHKEKVLNPSIGDYGRKSVTLWKNHIGTQFLVHTLVAKMFIGDLPSGLEICHNDGNASNNILENLRYDTPKSNNEDKKIHGTHLQGSQLSWTVLKEEDIPYIFSEYKKGRSQTSIAEELGVQQPNISRILNKKRWKHINED